MQIDLNADMGEGYGAFRTGEDESLLDWVSSVNVACGFHGGDPLTIRRTVRLALGKGIAVGAHPGFPDLLGFGRREWVVTPEEVYAWVVYQVGAVAALVRAEGGRLCHVKPHGALYNMAARDPVLAEAVATAVRAVDPALVLYGLAGSHLLAAGAAAGLRTASEVFADRTYQADGSLTPRHHPQALVHDPHTAAARVLQMVREGRVTALSGEAVRLRAETVCVHGDSPGAVAFVQQLRAVLERSGVRVQSPA
ncbi:MAG: LamB/YcsF family protein [Alicyclobacillus sp.]|nr:LamB/YcsF family protein [Alicyclobacillus sp.]